MQKRPGISVNLPDNYADILPIHADTWNGVSPFELNVWIPFVNCTDSMCLYILKRDRYTDRLKNSQGLLKLSSDELFNELRQDLTWIPIQYGKILAFDQSLPHGYSLNKEILDRFNKLIYEINKLASSREYDTVMNVINNIIISYNSSLLIITNIKSR